MIEQHHDVALQKDAMASVEGNSSVDVGKMGMRVVGVGEGEEIEIASR